MLLRISMYGWKIRNSVLFVTITNVLVPVFYHSMVEKQKPSFRHGAHDLFKSSGPDKGLLCHGCVQARKFFLTSLLYLTLHSGFLWFFICKRSTIFRTLSHIKLYGSGKGSGFLAMWSLSRLHILSYATITPSLLLSSIPSSRLRRYWMVIRKTWPGPSDLRWMSKPGNDKKIIDS